MITDVKLIRINKWVPQGNSPRFDLHKIKGIDWSEDSNKSLKLRSGDYLLRLNWSSAVCSGDTKLTGRVDLVEVTPEGLRYVGYDNPNKDSLIKFIIASYEIEADIEVICA